MMKQYPFSNIHAHVFNSECVPDNFLRILPFKVVRRMPKAIKVILDSKWARKLIVGFSKIASKKDSNKRNSFDKYIAFLNVATQRKQLDVFELEFEVGKQYDSQVRIVGLTMNMDFMDNRFSSRQISFETQLEAVKDIKRYYPKNFFPFLGIDPRHKSGMDLVNWSKSYFEMGLQKDGMVFPYFSGIKLYPALGFFAFDPRLDELYAYSEANQLPIVTHVTRVGSQYIGSKITELIPLKPSMILPENPSQEVLTARDNIYTRIQIYYDQKWVIDNKQGDNDKACDLFTHPENYIPLLEKFPRLKICLAHMGGSNELIDKSDKDPDLKQIRRFDSQLWCDRILEMMVHYPNLYTDISYTLSDLDDKDIRAAIVRFLNTSDNQGQPLAKRVLFGTDFFMTEQEKCESDLYKLAKEELADFHDLLTRENPQEFLRQPV
ncbi:amidohydrolase family protein [Fluviicola taffensis]|uniref:amidohydrolase family protein n=1 Tax=Fluviicola taffensis TaxID=191579 RepID=UPI0031383E1F